MEKKGYLNIFAVAATYTGSVIGAGFGSGQEILKFFTLYGIKGFFGLAITVMLFILFGVICMLMGHKFNCSSYHHILYHIFGRKTACLFDIIITFFLYGVLCVMLAGAGAVFKQYFNFPAIFGTLFTVILVIFTLYYGLKGINRTNFIIVPVLILFIVTLTFQIFSLNGFNIKSILPVLEDFRFPLRWFLSSLLYVSYNITLSIGILIPLGQSIANKKTILWGGILGGFILGFLALCINLLLLTGYRKIINTEIPLMEIANIQGDTFQLIYAFILWGEIFTTIISTLYGFSLRISNMTNLATEKVTVLSLIGGIFFSKFGFSNLLGFLYPMFGALSLYFVFQLLSTAVRDGLFKVSSR